MNWQCIRPLDSKRALDRLQNAPEAFSRLEECPQAAFVAMLLRKDCHQVSVGELRCLLAAADPNFYLIATSLEKEIIKPWLASDLSPKIAVRIRLVVYQFITVNPILVTGLLEVLEFVLKSKELEAKGKYACVSRLADYCSRIPSKDTPYLLSLLVLHEDRRVAYTGIRKLRFWRGQGVADLLRLSALVHDTTHDDQFSRSWKTRCDEAGQPFDLKWQASTTEFLNKLSSYVGEAESSGD
jgi:hypothetical protein